MNVANTGCKIASFLSKHRNIFILIFSLFAPMFFLIHYPLRGYLLVDGGDGICSISNWLFGVQGIYSGELPIWNKYIANGIPTVATGSGALINIPALLLGWLPIQWFVFFIYCIHISIAAYFMYLYLREIGCDSKAAFVVAAMLLFSIHLGGFRKSHTGIVFASSLFPVVMYFIQRNLNTEKMKYVALASGVIALAFSYTQVQHVVYIIMASGMYFIICLIKNKVKWYVLLKQLAFFAGFFFVFSAIILFPTAELVMEYSRHSNWQNPHQFQWTTASSMSPLILIYMLFPNFFDNIFANNGLIRSTGFDIEFFIGSAVLIVAIFSVKRYFRENFIIKLSVGICLITLMYMSHYYVPILRDIVYRIPVLNGFRLPSRMMFVFLFFIYTIIGIGLSKIKDEENCIRYFKFHYRFTIALIMICFVILFALIAGADIVGGHNHGKYLEDIFAFAQRAFLPICLTLLGLSAVLFFISRLSEKHFPIFIRKNFHAIILLVILLATIFQTLPFWRSTNSTIDITPDECNVIATLSDKTENGNIISSTGWHSGSSKHRNLLRNIPTIHSYVPFNNPFLHRHLTRESETPFNFTGLLAVIPNATEAIVFRNDLLSMMGVNYIISPADKEFPTHVISSTTPVFNSLNIQIPPSILGMQAYAEEVFIKPYSYYIVVVNYITFSEPVCDGYMYVAIHSKYNIYDLMLFNLNSAHMETVLFSGNIEPETESFISIVSTNLFAYVEILALNLYEVYKVESSIFYTPIFSSEHYKIFENINARDILYFSDEVRGIPDIDYIFSRPFTLNLDKISYIVNAQNQTFDLSGNNITDINFRNNSITSVVHSEYGGFLNFSQSYYPGWRVYINGQRAELEMVNALIMGVYVPPGTHEIKFSFVSMSFILGAIITCLGIVSCVIIFGVIEPRRERRKSLSINEKIS